MSLFHLRNETRLQSQQNTERFIVAPQNHDRVSERRGGGSATTNDTRAVTFHRFSTRLFNKTMCNVLSVKSGRGTTSNIFHKAEIYAAKPQKESFSALFIC